MSYATASDVLLWFGARELTEVAVPDDRKAIPTELLRLSIEGGVRDNFSAESRETADMALIRIQTALEEGQRLLDSYLATRYATPLAEAVVVASPLPRACGVLALSLLYDDQMPTSLKQKKHHVFEWLHDLMDGRVSLTFGTLSTDGVRTPSYVTGGRIFDAESLKGYV